MTTNATLTDEVIAAIARFFTGGAGPNHDAVTRILVGAGCDDGYQTQPGGTQGPSKERRVLNALRSARNNPDPARRLLDGLLDELRSVGLIDRTGPLAEPPTEKEQRLTRALAATTTASSPATPASSAAPPAAPPHTTNVTRMPFLAYGIRVLIASPGDATDERDHVERAVHDWNTDRASRAGLIMLPIRWETHSTPILGADPQAIINGQLVDDADIVMAFFDSRLGSVTPRGLSGTAEEIERAAEAKKPVHVWFSQESLPHDVDLDQVRRLREFKQAMHGRGLLGTYTGPEDLARQVRKALESDSSRWSPPAAAAAAALGTNARLRATVTEVGSVPGSYSLRITNTGSAPAEDLQVHAFSAGGQELQLDGPEPGTLLDGAHLTWKLWLALGDGALRRIQMDWSEAGRPHTQEQGV